MRTCQTPLRDMDLEPFRMMVMLRRRNVIAGMNRARNQRTIRIVTNGGGQRLLILYTLAPQKSFHEQREMLPWNAAALSGLRDDTAMLREFDTQVGLRKLFERSLLRLHVWKDGQTRVD